MGKPLCIIDRFEGKNPQWAVIEYDGKLTFNIPREILPENATDGDVLEFDIAVNDEETKSRRELAEALLKKLFKPK